MPFSGIILTASFTTLYKYTNNLFLCVLSHAWFNGCIGLALYVGNNGTLQLDLNWKVIVVFSLELIVSICLGIAYSLKTPLMLNNNFKPRKRTVLNDNHE